MEQPSRVKGGILGDFSNEQPTVASKPDNSPASGEDFGFRKRILPPLWSPNRRRDRLPVD
jgi:hypothetical protein